MSALRPFSRQYSCASSTCRISGSASSSPTRTSRIGQIAGDAVRPERFLSERVLRLHVGARREAIRRDTARATPAARTAARRRSRCRGDAACSVRVRGRQRERPGRRARLAVLLRQRDGGFVVRRDAGRERQPRESARREPDPLPQADDRIERRAGGVRQRSAVERLRDRPGRGRGPESGCDPFRIRARPAGGLRGSARGRPRARRRRIRRAAAGRTAPTSRRRNSVSTNSLPNAGCARSAAGVDSTISA